MELGIGLVGEHSSWHMVDLSRRIESSGFDQIWVSDERFYRDVFVHTTLVALTEGQVDDLNDAPRSAKCNAVIWDARSAW